MDILFLLIPLSVVLVFVIGAVFWLALKGGQFDDLESPGLDVVLDEDTHTAAQEIAPDAKSADRDPR
ncbi:MAG: cbb3-type cytochrome oxidase assembly protein CcoS [Betaproteobacteria bacterium]|nr:MAG: cbb3-type cytochrome oxidase assembly protein CcoS [Betaproteobacteria bacterium]